MTLSLDIDDAQGLTHRERRQLSLGRLGLLVSVARLVVTLFIGGEKPAEGDDRAARREFGDRPRGGGGCRGRAGLDAHRRRLPAGIRHLAGDSALPDQVVQLPVVAAQRALELARRAEHVARGSHGLVRLLRVLRLARVDARGLGDAVGAIERDRLRARRIHRLLRKRGRVGAHIGDVAVFVERLGHRHRLTGSEPQLASGLLLQGRRRERRRGSTRVRLRLDARDRDRDGRVSQRLGERGRERLVERDGVRPFEHTAVGEVAAARHLLAIEACEPRGEGSVAGGGGERGVEVPVARPDEREPLALAVDDESGCSRLHAARTETRPDLAPQHGADLVAVEAVEDAPRLLRVDKRRIELARVVDSALDGLRRDLVKDHALDGHGRLEHLEQVPRDGFALAVFISREPQLVGALECPLEVGDRLLLRVGDDVVGLEAVVDVDREFAERALLQLGRKVLGLDEVANVPDRGLHLIVVAEVFADRLRLGGRLDDDQLLALWHGAP